ncbi:endo alpha-1,4 polygalactosaminidase [Actinoplanes sp. NPDC051494]|uniref:endo alpha-1,4 polygalactosaminidase n=1 Tax=Actinoplanes sp. NPDC051494 TaxID=3363907 RepID=UPI003795BFFB
MIRLGLVLLVLLGYATPAQAAAGWWRPKASAATRWQIQFTGPIDLTVPVTVFDLDGDGTTAAQVARLHQRGVKAICYVSAGSYEDWRADAKRFPAAVLGADLDGWPGEKWLDVRRWDVLGPIMRARFQSCRAKGFDAVDPDNMDGYANKNGVGLTAADQLTYNRRIAALAHGLGLAVGLKNDLDQIPALVGAFDFAVNEQCAYFHECDLLKPFVTRGKPVFQIEYEVAPATFCPASRKLGFAAVLKKQDLGAYRRAC